MPTVDEAFPERRVTIDEAFPVELERERTRQKQFNTSPVQDLIFGGTEVNPVARVLDAFGQGVRHAWGQHNDTVEKESEDFLKASKKYDEWIKGQTGITKAANETLFRPAASQLYREFKDVQALVHGFGAGIEGTKAAIAQIGTEVGQEKLGREVAAGFEAFPTGFRQPAGTFPRMSPVDYMKEVDRARDLKTIGVGEGGYQGTAEVPAPSAKDVASVVREETPAVPPIAEAPIEQPAPIVSKPISAEHPIAQDVAGRLVAAGRPAEEASAAGQIIASHYETRAQRFGGALGSAEDLYAREGADIRGRGGKAAAPEEVVPEPKPVEGGAAGEMEFNQGGLKEFNQAAYHGSPYDFEAFDTGKIGTGEGAQAYGHGLYFAENEKVAKGYQDNLSRASLKAPDGSLFDPSDLEHLNVRVAAYNAREKLDIPIAKAREILSGTAPAATKEMAARDLAKLETLKAQGGVTSNSGNLYRVNIKPEPHEFLQWDKPLNKQTPEIQEKLKQAMGEAKWNEFKAADTSTAIKQGFIASDDVLTSKRLADAGIPGIRYLDGNSRATRNLADLEARLSTEEKALAGWDTPKNRDGWLQGPESFDGFLDNYRESIKDLKDQIAEAKANPQTHNYVVFDPKHIEILDKNGKPVSKKEFELEQVKRGKIRLREDAKPIITLFKDANESTFMHETGHQWLEELMRDAGHKAAPADLIADSKAVLDWFGVDDASKIRVRHHEQFARGFERYLMEGTAPSRELATVFAKFRDWLTRIYETVTRLKSPINDEIRGVFDRMIALEPEKVRIEPEAPKAFSDIHEADALHTAPEAARPVAQTIRAERDRLASEHIPEEHDARLEGIASGTERREAGGPQPVRDVNEAGSRPQEAGDNPASGAVGEGGSGAAPEGNRPSAQSRTEAPVSAGESFKPADTGLVDKAGNIRLENLNQPEDVLQAIRDSAARNNDFLDQRRNVVTDGDAVKLADAMGIDVAYLNTKRVGEAWNKEEIFGLEKLLIQSATSVRDAMKNGDVVEYASAKAKHLMIHDFIQGKASAARAEAGRSLQAFAALKKMNGSQDARQLSEFLKENSDNKTLFQLEREMQLGQQYETPAQISRFIEETMKPSFKDMIIEGWMAFLLSGLKTHMANIMGNTISGLWRPLETATAAGIGKARSLITGSQDRVLFGEAAAELFGMVQGSKEGIVAAYKAFKTEEPQTTGTRQAEKAYPRAIPSATVNVLGREMEIGGKQIRIPLRLLGAEDEFYKNVAFRGDINRQAYAIAAKENLTPERTAQRVAELSMSPTEEMITHAKGVADYQTFQTPLGKTGRAVQNFANSHFLAKLIIPFVRTPVNLLKYASERTPLGIWSREVRDNLSGKNGGAARDTQIARITLGTMIGVAAFEAAQNGLITGGGPSDKGKKAIMQADGWQEYSIKVGDMYYKYNRLDPFSIILGLAADTSEIMKAAGHEKEKEHLVNTVFAAITKNVTDRASLKGPSDFIQALTDPERFGKGYIKGMVGTVIPAISAQTAQTVDPVMREARTLVDGLKARIPGLSQTLHPRRDIWGNEVVREGGLGPDIASPIAEARIKNDPVNKALLAANYFPGKLDRKIRGVELSDQQYDDYSRIAGRTAKMRLDTIVQMPGFEQMPESVRKDLMTKAIVTSREMARSLIMMQNPEILRKANDAKMAKTH